jgi:hypothetical protein
MRRRSFFVAMVAAAATLVPAGAQAATPTVTSAAFASPVTFSWTPDALAVTESLIRAPGACPQAGGTVFPSEPVGAPSTRSDAPGDGVFCYSVQTDPELSGPVGTGVTVTVDTAPPTAGAPAPAFTGAPNFVRGTVTVTATSSDTTTPVTDAFHLGTAACDGTSPGIVSPWVTTAVADGAYIACNVATDGAGHAALSAAVPVIVDNALPTGSVVSPVGIVVGGTAVVLTTNAADATSGIRTVRWQRSVDGTTLWGNGNIPASNPANSLTLTWNTTTGTGLNHPADGPLFLRAVVTDNAGNVFNTPAAQVTIDNTAPDVKAVVTAPAAVAGSPTLNWTPAHDAIGISRYDVLRGGVVIGTVPTVAGATNFSFNDKNAPDKATSNYVVRAYDGANHFADSDAVSVLVDSSAVSAARSVSAVTPTSAAPVLNWLAPSAFTVNHYDIYRDGLPIGSTVGAGLTFTDSAATEGTHDYAVLARDPAAHPGVLSSSFKVVYDKTAPKSGGSPTAQVQASGQVDLAWPAAADALSGVAGYVVRRASGATPPAALDGGSAVCAPAAPGCSDVAAGNGTWSYGVFARDAAGNVALIGTVSNITVHDKTPPLAPTKLKVTRPKSRTKSKRGSVTFALHWVKPTAPDLDRIVVVLNLKRPPVGPADGKTVYHGLGSGAKLKLQPGQNGYVAIYAFDHSGNYSPKPVRKLITLASLISLRPLSGSVVRTTSPQLTWKARNGSTYYNIQVFRNGKRLLVAWPSEPSYRIAAGKLKPGTYVWFVWPAVQHTGSAPTFGKLIGRATFTYEQ